MSEEATREQKAEARRMDEREKELQNWVPKTIIGKKVKAGDITNLEDILKKNIKILEPEIIEILTKLEEKIVDIAKTTRVVRAGRKFSFRASVLVGNKNGLIGLGTAKDNDKWAAIKKATRAAKLNIIQVERGSGSWEEQTTAKHSVPFKVIGKTGGVKLTLLPAPRGTGLVVGDNIKDVMIFAGIENVWGKARGASTTKLNFVSAAVDALSKTAKAKGTKQFKKKIGEAK